MRAKLKSLEKELDIVLEVHCHIGSNIGDVALGAMGRGNTTAVGEAVNGRFAKLGG
jgi:class 3 adenylate cyclase